MKIRKSPKAARDANPDNAYRKARREHHKELGVSKGKEPKVVRMPQKDVDAANKRLAEHFKGQKSPPHKIKIKGFVK